MFKKIKMTILSMFCKGVFIPGMIVISSMITSIVNYYTNAFDCGKITGYLDGNLYTDARPINDMTVMNLLIVYMFFYFVLNFLTSKSSGNKDTYYFINALLSIASPLVGLLWMEYPTPEIPANIYYSMEEKYIMLENVSLTFLRDEENKVRIIMASEKFQGFSPADLSPGPWMIPFSFSWMNMCLEQVINFQYLIKEVYIVLLILSSLYAGILILVSYLKYRRDARVKVEEEEEEKKTMI